MHDENQSFVPQSFVELFVARGRMRPSEPWEVILARYELCEDMAQLLVEHASTTLFALGGTGQAVLEQVHRGLLAEDSVVRSGEARWVTVRLAELLGWAPPDCPPDAG
jgi:hypothetical protein